MILFIGSWYKMLQIQLENYGSYALKTPIFLILSFCNLALYNIHINIIIRIRGD